MKEESHIDDPTDCAFIEMEMPEGWQSGGADKGQLRHRGMVREAGIRLPHKEKVEHSKKVISSAMQRPATWGVSYSGGADSTVVKHLVEAMGIDLPSLYADTRMEYQQTRQQIATNKSTLVARSSTMPIQVWKDGIPILSKMIASKVRQYQATGNERHLLRVPEKWRAGIKEITRRGILVSDKCCDVLKKAPMKAYQKAHGITGAITGVRAAESRNRKLAWLQRGSLYHSSRNGLWICNPLAFWTSEDVDRYLEDHDIEFHRAPLRGSGCMACGFGCHLAETENNLQWLHREKPKMWKVFVEQTRMAEAMDVLGISCRSES